MSYPKRSLKPRARSIGRLLCALAALVLTGCSGGAQSAEGVSTTSSTTIAATTTASTTTTAPTTTSSTEPPIEFPPSSPGRDGPIVYQLDPPVPVGYMASVQGRLWIHGNGCSRVGNRGVVWPNGTTWDHASNEVVMGDGRRFDIDDELSGAGGYTSAKFVAELDMSRLESQVGAEVADHAEQCYGTSEIAVLNNWSGTIDLASDR